MAQPENTREKMTFIVEWLGWQNESMSYGLKSVRDAEMLYDYWQAHDDLPEMADGYDDDNGNLLAPRRIKAIGYDPLEQE